jgi:hypothetical protein
MTEEDIIYIIYTVLQITWTCKLEKIISGITEEDIIYIIYTVLQITWTCKLEKIYIF